MTNLEYNVRRLLKERKIPFKKMLLDLNLSKDAFKDINALDNTSILLIATYLRVSISELFKGGPDALVTKNYFCNSSKEQIISRILDLFDKSGLSDQSLQKEIGISNSIIFRWRRRQNGPSVEYIVRICKYFEVTSDYILFGK